MGELQAGCRHEETIISPDIGAYRPAQAKCGPISSLESWRPARPQRRREDGSKAVNSRAVREQDRAQKMQANR
jgi:hypothetical protein